MHISSHAYTHLEPFTSLLTGLVSWHLELILDQLVLEALAHNWIHMATEQALQTWRGMHKTLPLTCHYTSTAGLH